MNKHPVQWTSPSPLWARFGSVGALPGSSETITADDQFRPAILRFASDDFMDQLLATLARDPKAISELLARPETWRTPAGNGRDLIDRVPLPRFAKTLRRLQVAKEVKAPVEPTVAEVTRSEQAHDRTISLKLYQPAHQRFYLVASDLVCGTAGFPQRAIATGGREQIGFVMRRLFPAPNADASAPLVEHAFVKDTSGARWQPVDKGNAEAALLAEEELLPLFAVKFDDDVGHPRRVLAGMIPVGRREEYMSTGVAKANGAAGDASAGVATSKISARKEQFKLEVAEPWKNLIRTALALQRSVNDPRADDPKPGSGETVAYLKSLRVLTLNLQLQQQSWLILLDFVDYLKAHLTSVWDAITAGNRSGLSGAKLDLYDWLDQQAVVSIKLQDALVPRDKANQPLTSLKGVAKSMRDALARIGAFREKLEAADVPYTLDNATASSWPDFHFLLAGVNSDSAADGPYAALSSTSGAAPDIADQDPVGTIPNSDPQTLTDLVDRLVVLVVSAFKDDPDQGAPPLPFAATLQRALMNSDNANDPGWFAIRCVFERCDCGPLHPTLLSARTQKFQLASFFDPDAPARPIRISLPLDTTPAGLRKFNKNTAFMISDVLCGQIARAKGLGFIDLVLQVLPWPLHKDIDVGGMGPCKNANSLNIGMICSLSIPIITICALILLIIIVTLLDFIFRWMPYFIMCFPVPGLKAKK